MLRLNNKTENATAVLTSHDDGDGLSSVQDLTTAQEL